MSFTVQFDMSKGEELREGLKAQGFSFSTPPHTLFQAKKKGVSCTLYTSGKLVVQGKGMREFIEYYLEPEVLQAFSYGYENLALDLTPRIGVDESGKGDFFGPLCVAGVYGNETSIPTLVKIGVKDSKRLSDSTILKLAPKIRKECIHHIVRIGPKRYNELYEKFGNLNLLLAWGHATVIEELLDKTACPNVVVDQFAAEHVVELALKRKKKEALLKQRHRAEEDVVVAAASILARSAFLEGMEGLSKEWKIDFPKGANPHCIAAGKKLVHEHGSEVLPLVAKLHFKTTEAIK